MSVCLHISKSKSNASNVRITEFDKVISYMDILFLLYYRDNEHDEHMMMTCVCVMCLSWINKIL